MLSGTNDVANDYSWVKILRTIATQFVPPTGLKITKFDGALVEVSALLRPGGGGGGGGIRNHGGCVTKL